MIICEEMFYLFFNTANIYETFPIPAMDFILINK